MLGLITYFHLGASSNRFKTRHWIFLIFFRTNRSEIKAPEANSVTFRLILQLRIIEKLFSSLQFTLVYLNLFISPSILKTYKSIPHECVFRYFKTIFLLFWCLCDRIKCKLIIKIKIDCTCDLWLLGIHSFSKRQLVEFNRGIKRFVKFVLFGSVH